MKKYKISFIGRLAGAIGKTYRIRATVEANSPEEAKIKLYEKYDCITQVTIK